MNKAEKFWDKNARKYAKQPVKDEKGYRQTLEDTRKYLGQEKVVLELGCGTGTTALKLAGDVKELIATDISSQMITIANEKKAAQKVENVQFAQCTLFDESLKSGSFDVILAYNLIHLLEDTDSVMKRINDLLKPGGVFISKTMCLREQSRFWPVLATVVAKVLRIGCIQNFTVDEHQATMTKAGFEVLETHLYYPKPPRLFAVAKKVS